MPFAPGNVPNMLSKARFSAKITTTVSILSMPGGGVAAATGPDMPKTVSDTARVLPPNTSRCRHVMMLPSPLRSRIPARPVAMHNISLLQSGPSRGGNRDFAECRPSVRHTPLGPRLRGDDALRLIVLAVLLVVDALLSPAIAQPMSRAEARARAAALSALGQELFLDPRLSASGQLACASCHSPEHEFGPPNARAVQLGGTDMRQPGLRATPSLKYLQATPQSTE